MFADKGNVVELPIVWNVLLTSGVAVLGWIIRLHVEEMNRISLLLHRTREKIAREYITRVEFHNETDRVLDRLNTLDNKLDRLLASKSSTSRGGE